MDPVGGLLARWDVFTQGVDCLEKRFGSLLHPSSGMQRFA